MKDHAQAPDKTEIVNFQDWHCDAIRFTHVVSRYRDQENHQAKGTGDVVRMHFGIKGNYDVTYPQIHRSYQLIGGHHNILYADPFDMEFYNRSPEIETFGIQFPTAVFIDYTRDANDPLKRFSEKIIKGQGAVLSNSWGTIDLPIQQVINQVLSCQYTDGLKKLFFLSKSIELLVLCAESYAAAETAGIPFIKNAGDKEKIIAVRDLINERTQSPPNLSEIARMVGMNEYKLKRGFKELFHTTIFNYLTEQRLTLARRFLLDTRKNVSEIAYELGYATPQHFNNAFRKKFGQTPNLVRKNP